MEDKVKCFLKMSRISIIFFQVCFSLKGPFKPSIRVVLSHQYAVNETHDSTRSSTVSFSLDKSDIETNRINCFDLQFHLDKSAYLLEQRSMIPRSFLHVTRIEFLRDDSIQHLDFVEDLFLDNFWIGKPSCMDVCPKDSPLEKCTPVCMGIKGLLLLFVCMLHHVK